MFLHTLPVTRSGSCYQIRILVPYQDPCSCYGSCNASSAISICASVVQMSGICTSSNASAWSTFAARSWYSFVQRLTFGASYPVASRICCACVTRYPDPLRIYWLGTMCAMRQGLGYCAAEPVQYWIVSSPWSLSFIDGVLLRQRRHHSASPVVSGIQAIGWPVSHAHSLFCAVSSPTVCMSIPCLSPSRLRYVASRGRERLTSVQGGS